MQLGKFDSVVFLISFSWVILWRMLFFFCMYDTLLLLFLLVVVLERDVSKLNVCYAAFDSTNEMEITYVAQLHV